jgi:hypothetical protein
MAACAIAKIAYSFLPMLFVDFRLIVLVAVVASVISERIGMASCAARGSVTVIEGKAMGLIEGCRTPRTRAVAGLTRVAE